MAGFKSLYTLFPFKLCYRNVQTDAIECSLCQVWVHRKCAKITKHELNLFCKSGNDWYCRCCEQVFPFYSLEDEELSNLQLYDKFTVQSYELYKSCSRFNVKTFEQTDYRASAREMDLDPDLNFYNSVVSECHYYTESQFSQNVNSQSGLSIIHFNARSLKANITKIQDYLVK